jgi:glucose-1-phosphate adenylyltransferase
VVRVDQTSRVLGFEEKPASPQPLTSNPSAALVSMGVYVFNKPILLGALDTVCGTTQEFDFGRDLIPALSRSVRTFAYDFRDTTRNLPRYWRDIGTVDAY